ncbi:MAG: AAA family ATPase [Aggregatilineales bacterium]
MTDTPPSSEIFNVPPPEDTGITRITVAGFKSIYDEQSIEIRPLTILAGANSSGKSSIMQPLLLLKQTLETNYDFGPLKLNGPNVFFTTIKQILSRLEKNQVHQFSIDIRATNLRPFSPDDYIAIDFGTDNRGYLKILAERYLVNGRDVTLREDVSHNELSSMIGLVINNDGESTMHKVGGTTVGYGNATKDRAELRVIRNRFLLVPAFVVITSDGREVIQPIAVTAGAVGYISSVIHVPGARNRDRDTPRSYPMVFINPTFPGTFDYYVAGVIENWQTQRNPELKELEQDLRILALTSKVVTRRINDTQIEILVARASSRKKGETRDLVNIADIGFGVSQALPVVTALHVASPGQMVYLEEPELHLHPRAQQTMAQILAEAAMRGVRVVAETHSALLLLGVQTLVAEGKLPPDLVKLHWFTRGEDGRTQITSADLDENGAFGEWPEDFGMVELDAQSRYLDAVEGRHFGQPING